MYINQNMDNTIIEVNDMKEKVKRFFIEKKELIIFIGVVVLVFAAVITVASIAMNNGTTPVATPADTTSQTSSTTTKTNSEPTMTIESPMVFEMPITGEYVEVRGFFDPSLSDEELQACMIDTGSKVIASVGISYAKNDNSVFSASAIYDGEVVSIVEDELSGSKVTIKHSDSVYSIYSSLSDVKVSLGDIIKQGKEIGLASASINDALAGVHVHVQIQIDGKYVNPTSVYGKALEDLVQSK